MHFVDVNDENSGYADVGEAYTDAVRTLREQGKTVVGHRPEKEWQELTGCTAVLRNPAARILRSTVRPLDIVAAAARFVWMMSGEDRADPITYYVPSAAGFARNGRIPGSSYGRRLRRPGGAADVDQVRGVVRRLRAEPRSRQAAAVVWQPEDAVREPFDIPCALAVAYQWRSRGLVATTVMRSTKPLTLFPLNVFEFTLLGEVIAAELGTRLASYVHTMLVTQLPRVDAAAADALLAEPPASAWRMPPVPHSPGPLAQLRLLAEAEPAIRAAEGYPACRAQVERAELDPYWAAFGHLLALRRLTADGRWREALTAADEVLPQHFLEPFAQRCLRAREPRRSHV